MIEDIFQKATLPNILHDCNIDSNDQNAIYIGRVYVFNANNYFKIIKFGSLHTDDFVFRGKRIVGYFSTQDFKIRNMDGKICRILGKNAADMNYQIEGVSFVKTRDSHAVGSRSRIGIKFVANNIKYF